MKPIKLSLAGLHSYRGRQEIDFAQLSDLGVFGIFGPTGSGKSTILDAMTLALYGSVKRAKGGKQAIINQEEKTAEVAFEFSIGRGEQQRIYRVERKYRTDARHLSVQNTLSRLMDVTGEVPVVLADQAGLVDVRLYEILGLTLEDFSRAVVLPQGSFSEFLRLSGADRRKMLERLFSLEKYGQKLVGKLNTRMDQVKGEKNRIEGAQSELGDASAAAMEAARTRMAEAKDQETMKQAAHEAVLKKHVECEKIHGLQVELSEKATAIERHAQRKTEISQIETTVLQAGKALAVRPFRERSEGSQDRDAQAKKLAAACAQMANEKKEILQQLTEEHERARTLLREQEPELIRMGGELQEAQKLEAQLFSGRSSQRTAEKELHEKEVQLHDLEAAAQNNQSKEVSCSKEICEMERRLQENQVPSEQRELIRMAMERAAQWEKICRDLEDNRQKLSDRQKAAVDAAGEREKLLRQQADYEKERQTKEGQLVEFDRACPADEKELHEEQIRLTQWNLQVQNLQEMRVQGTELLGRIQKMEQQKTALSETLSRTGALLKQARELQELAGEEWTKALQNDRRRMAAALAEELASGVSCPVCGSEKHPCPAPRLDGLDSAHLEEMEARIATAKEKVAALDGEYQGRSNEAAQLDSSIEGVVTAMQDNGKRTAAVCAALAIELTSPECVGDAQACFAGVVNRQKESEIRMAALAAWRIQKDTMEQMLQQVRELEGGLNGPVAAAGARVNAAEAECVRTTEEVQALALKLAEAEDAARRSAAQANIPLAPNTEGAAKQIVQASKAVVEKDKQAELLSRELVVKRQEEARIKELLSLLLSKKEAAGVAHAALKTVVESSRKTLAENEKSLAALTGGRLVGELLAETRGLLMKLKNSEEIAQQKKYTAEAAFGKAGESVAAANATSNQTGEVCAAELDRLFATLKENGFSDSAAAKAAELPASELTLRQEEVREYQEQQQLLQVERMNILSKLDGRFIAENEWSDLQLEMENTGQARAEGTRVAIETRRDYEDIAVRHSRWSELEKDREAFAKQLQNLEIIQQTIRGNMLVEFLAQEQMGVVLKHASERLKQLTGNRYALEMDSEGGFLVRDDANGGLIRPVSTLSGGETFQTSLGLALALSTHIQLKGRYPLEFFFLDEGFGSLDPKTLEVAMSTLEQLHMERMTIGIISHVAELQQRMLRRLIVHPAEPAGKGSWVEIEIA